MSKLLSIDYMVDEARKRGVAVVRYDGIHRGFACLKLGNHREFVFQSQSDLIGRASARLMNNNKVLANFVLREAGFPVPEDGLISSLEEAEACLQEWGRVVIKPLDNTGGKGVTPNLRSNKELEEALLTALAHNVRKEDRVVCQQHVEGREYRLLVINQKHVFALERVGAHALGDGEHTVKELVDLSNEKARSRDYWIKKSDTVEQLLVEQGLTWQSTPKKGEIVRMALVINAHQGGTVHDATDVVGKEARKLALEVAAYFDTSLVGLDVITPDIQKTPGVIIEMNPSPDLAIHHRPDSGQARDVTKYIIDLLFPETVGK